MEQLLHDIELKFTTAGDFMRYAANGMPMVEKKVVPQPVVKETPKSEPVEVQPKEEDSNVNILNDDVEEGNVSEDNE